MGTARLALWLAETAHVLGGRAIVRSAAADAPTALGQLLDALDPFQIHRAPTLARVRGRRALDRVSTAAAIDAVVQVTVAVGPSVWCLDEADHPIVRQVARGVLGSAAPACVVVTARPGRVAEIAAALGRPRHAPIPVPPLDRSALVHLMRQRLRIASGLAERIVARIPSAPGVAIQVLDALTPQLIETPAGLDLPPDAPLDLPSAATRVWQAAIEEAWRDAPEAERDSLVALAVLDAAPRADWVALCTAAALPVADTLLDRLADADLARVGADAICFAHAAIPAAICAARPARVPSLHRLAAEVRAGGGFAERRARALHALAGDDAPLALRVLEDFADDYASVNELPTLLPLITACRQATADHSMRLDALEARVAFALGDRPRAARCLARVDLDALPSARLRFTVVETRSLLHLANGAHGPADALIAPLYAYAGQGDATLQVRARLAHARTAMIGRQYAQVIDLIAALPPDTLPALAVRGEIFVQDALVASGRAVDAIARLPRVFALAHAADSPGLLPHVEMYAGNAYLHGGDYPRARAHFDRALALDSDRMPAAAYFHLNLAIVDLHEGKARAALDRIETLAPRLARWPIRIGQLMDAIWLQAAARLRKAEIIPDLLNRLEATVDADVATDTHIAIQAALADLDGPFAARAQALLARTPPVA